MSDPPSSLGLLADYDSSDEESSDGGESGGAAPTQAQKTPPSGTVNYFEGDDISSDEDSGKDPVGMVRLVDIAPSSPACSVDYLSETRLPAPKLGPAVEPGKTPGQSGIFANPFQAEQKTQLSLLQKHVQLTVQERPAEIGGRKICLAYRKDGRCRFGRTCKFAHDSDLQVSSNAGIAGSRAGEAAVQVSTQEWAGGKEEVVFENVQPVPGKRKPGLSQTLIPPKRSMKNYRAQLGKERPWVLIGSYAPIERQQTVWAGMEDSLLT